MNTTQTLFLCAVMALTILVFAYWVMVYPVVRKALAFRIERDFDRLRLLAMEDRIPAGSQGFAKVRQFVLSGFRAAESDGWLMMAKCPSDEVRAREARLRALFEDLANEQEEVQDIVDRTFSSIVAIYLVQRPLLLFSLAPAVVAAHFFGRAKKRLQERELRYAAETLTPVWQGA